LGGLLSHDGAAIVDARPFQGALACVYIPFEKGVCGAAARERKTQLVPDIDQFPGHIACSSLSKSEIVVPLVVNSKTQLVLDVDSDKLNDFDAADQKYLEAIVKLIRKQQPNVLPSLPRAAMELGICKGRWRTCPS